MSYSDIIPSWVLHEMLKGYQPTLPLYTPEYWIEEEDCCLVPDRIKCVKTEQGSDWASHGTVDHPSFTRLRNHLEARGYIETQRTWCNGDRVIKKFILNDVLFDIGAGFPSASAMRFALFKD